MAIQPIRLFGDPVLRTPADPVRDFDKELRRLVTDLSDTMVDADGAGLAAPQIGVGLRVFTYNVDGVVDHLINPTVELSDEEQDDDEGCLSFPGLVYEVTRAAHAVARGQNMYGEPVEVRGSDRVARALQHETDHLDGVLFIDRMDRGQRRLAMREIRESELSGQDRPAVKVSPHPTHGRAL